MPTAPYCKYMSTLHWERATGHCLKYVLHGESPSFSPQQHMLKVFKWIVMWKPGNHCQSEIIDVNKSATRFRRQRIQYINSLCRFNIHYDQEGILWKTCIFSSTLSLKKNNVFKKVFILVFKRFQFLCVLFLNVFQDPQTSRWWLMCTKVYLVRHVSNCVT